MRRDLARLLGGGRVLAVLAAGIAVGYFLFDGGPPAERDGAATGAEEAPQAWTCAMHPQIQKPGPGACPICGMDLVPIEAGAADAGPRSLAVSPADRALMRVRTVPVERRYVEAEVRLVGKVAYDETRLADITSWVPGRIDRLYVDYTGVAVREGDHMVYLYSPEIYAAQQELLQARAAVQAVHRSDVETLRNSAERTLAATRDRLRLWGLTAEQIAAVEERGTPAEHVTIHSPSSGIVIHRNAREGMYVETGTRILTIADLSRVWILLDVYESDLTWLRYGQEVTFGTAALPGEEFAGTISFIDPMLDPVTRTVKVRVVAQNDDGRLKPDMFVRATVRASVAGHGKVMDPALVGKWISPMHPEVVKDGPGDCDVCGMDLVPAEELGYVASSELETERPLVIPATAPLLTGKRAVVYVEVPDADEPTYEGREVVLGPRAGEHYIVRRGLAEGELVVVEGAFKIDSALQIQARPSMMSPAPDSHAEALVPLPPEEREALDAAWAAYVRLRDALASDDAPAARNVLAGLRTAMGRARLASGHGAPDEESDLDALRVAFEPLSEALEEAFRRHGAPEAVQVLLVHCPMAIDGRGADWLQAEPEVGNPYLGQSMLRCGSVTETLPPAPNEESDGR